MVCYKCNCYTCSNCPQTCPKHSAQRSTPHYQGNHFDTVNTNATAVCPPRHHISPSSTRGDPVLGSYVRHHESPPSASAAVPRYGLRSPGHRNHRPLPFPYDLRQGGCSPSPDRGPNIDYIMAQLGINSGPPVSCSPLFTRPNCG